MRVKIQCTDGTSLPECRIAANMGRDEVSHIVSGSHSPSPCTDESGVGLDDLTPHWAVILRFQSYTHKDTDSEVR